MWFPLNNTSIFNDLFEGVESLTRGGELHVDNAKEGFEKDPFVGTINVNQ